MKLIYCIRALYNPGGMERVLVNKVTWLVRELGWEILVVTTDQKGRPTFYPFPKEVRMIDLGINYSDDNDFSPCRKIAGYLRRRRRHRRALTNLLLRERADVVVSLFSFLLFRTAAKKSWNSTIANFSAFNMAVKASWG